MEIIYTEMNKITLLLIMTASLIASCGLDEKKSKSQSLTGQQAELYQNDTEAYELLKDKCYICHNPAAASHDDLIAPPMAAVKMRYRMWYPDENEFTAALTSWVLEPKPENALMKGAVDRFKVMPRQEFEPGDVQKIALYIYQNKLETPAWFATHSKNMHGRGRGMRRVIED